MIGKNIITKSFFGYTSMSRIQSGTGDSNINTLQNSRGANKMTPEEVQAARDWAARKMEFKSSEPFGVEWLGKGLPKIVGLEKELWVPDKDANQCFMLVDRMRELGWFLIIGYEWRKGMWPVPYIAQFCNPELGKYGPQIFDIDLGRAIIRAAMATDPASSSPPDKP